MSDPFEEPTVYNGATISPIRETSVQQAVSFLNDPRVKAADPTKAISFLRKKGVTDDELREAYRRCGLPQPAELTNGFNQQNNNATLSFPATSTPFQPNHSQLYPHPNNQLYQPQQQRSSWFSLFLGITAAAGLYAAVREVLKRYVVPLYFPDAARIAEERRRREEHTFYAQERQIAELRDRIQDLLTTSERTNDKVENLSKSISSSMALRQQELSEASDLRNAIRQLSHSVTASGGTDVSRQRKEISPMLTETNAHGSYFQGTNQAHKLGSLSYSHVNNFSTVETNKAPTVGGPSYMNQTKNEAEGLAAGHGTINDTDDFMTLPPAEVQDSWRVQPMTGKTKDETERISEHKVHVGDSNQPGCIVEDPKTNTSKNNSSFMEKHDQVVEHQVSKSSNKSPVYSDLSRRLFHNTNQQNGVSEPNEDITEKITDIQKSEDGNTNTVTTTDVSMNQGETGEISKQDENQSTEKNGRMLFDMSNVGIVEEDEITPLDETQTEEAKAALESDMLEEADKLFRSHRARGDVKEGRIRPLSMPAIDAPLSDTEF